MILRSRGFVRSRGKLNFYVSTCNRSMVPNHGKVLTYCEGFPPINSHKLLNMWSRNITGQIKKTISPLSQCLWSQSVDQSIDPKVCLSCDVSWRHVYLGNHETGGIVRSSDKLSTFLLLQDTHGRQSRQGDDLPWENPTIIDTWPYLTREQYKITWQSEKLISLLSQDLWPLNLAGCWLMRGWLAHTNLSQVITKFLLLATEKKSFAVSKGRHKTFIFNNYFE